MKKVLFATTALVATSGMAMADIDVSGYIEVGVIGGDGGSGYAAGETQFLQHWGVTFSGSGTTDNGLSFGFTGQLDDTSDQNANTNDDLRLDSETAWISGSWGTLTMGDTDGAFDWAMQEVGYGTAIADDHTSHAGFSGNGGFDGGHDDQVLRYNHSVGDFGFAVSVELDDTGANDDNIGVGITYDMALGGVDVGLGLAHQSGTDSSNVEGDITGVSLDLSFAGGFGARLNFSDMDMDDGSATEHTGVGVSYSTGNLLLEANYGEKDNTGSADEDGWGVAVNYDLGGGAVAMFGYGDGDTDESWSLGLGMSF